MCLGHTFSLVIIFVEIILVLQTIIHNLWVYHIHVKSPSLGGRLPLFDPISLLNIHLPPRRGKLPLFWACTCNCNFLLKKTELYWIFFMTMHCLVSKVSTKYRNIIKVCRQSRKTFLLLYCLFFIFIIIFLFLPTTCVLRFLCYFTSDLSHIWPVDR